MTSPNPRRVFVFGGSNSLLRGGWVDRLAQIGGDRLTVINRSIGSATTLMGSYRLLTTPDLRPGDVALWEYAINDTVHMKGGAPLAVLLDNMRWFLELCARRGVTVLPVVMPTKGQIQKPNPDRYGHGLRALLNKAQISFYDCAPVVHQVGGSHPALLYRDQLHFDLEGEITTRFATDIAALLQEARFDHAAPSRLFPGLQGKDLIVQDRFEGSEGQAFGNSLVAGRIHSPGFRFPALAAGLLKGVIVVATRDGGSVFLQSGNNELGPYSLRCIVPDEKARMFQLKHLVPEFHHHPLGVPVVGSVSFLAASRGTPALRHTGFEPPAVQQDSRTGLVALLIETGSELSGAGKAMLAGHRMRRPAWSDRVKMTLQEARRRSKAWLRRLVRKT